MKRTLLLAALALWIALPLVISCLKPAAATFAGTDDQAQNLIRQMQPDYKPWASPFWQAPSPEVSTLLFSLQAALGAGIVGYYLGYIKGRAQNRSPQ